MPDSAARKNPPAVIPAKAGIHTILMKERNLTTETRRHGESTEEVNNEEPNSE